MPVHSESIVGLFGKLCDLHLGETKRCHLVQPKVSREVHFQRLRRKAFDTLFSFLRSPESKKSGVSGEGVRVEVDGVLQAVYQLRRQRRFEDADRLELLLEHILEGSREEDASVLKFLVQLAGSGAAWSSLPLGHDTYNTPVVEEDTKRRSNLPSGPVCYGDFKQPSASGDMSLVPYMHFPAGLFEVIPPAPQGDTTVTGKPQSVFSLPPGCGIGGSGLFSAEREAEDSHEQQMRLSLFGGLVQARDTTLAVRLDLPDLPDDPQANPPEITVPKAISFSELSEDEGFITTEDASTATTPGESVVEEDIWELALTTTPSQHYVWERIGCEPMVTEQRYLTEAGPQALDELCHLRRHHEHLLEPGTSHPPVRQVSSVQLIKDVIYLLIGIPSHTFPFSQADDKFTIDPSVSTPGLSPEALHSFLWDLVRCGTHYRRLTVFSAAMELDSMYTGGLVLQAFKGAVRSVLQHYRAAVLCLPKGLTLLGLRMHCNKVVRQIGYLAELCHCADKAATHTPDSAFPLGVSLISYLYEETLDCVNTDNYLMMLSILRTTCHPFVLFVQDWVFHGTFRDVYGEFMIQMNHKFLECRDEHYWEKGYTLTTDDETASVPSFLSHLAPSIFRCGKALNLLRMCCPEHFLCGVSDNEIPRVSISYVHSDLRDINVQCQMYVSRMQQVARRLTMTRAEQLRRAQEAQQQLLETARRMAAMEIARLQGILDERKRKQDAKKRIEFRRLKNQMEADLQRRAGEVSDAKAADAEYMARVTRQEEALTEKEIQLEEQARDELIAYYTELGEEAARREQRALWRIRRARLELARIQMLAEDEEKWRVEMEEQKQAQKLLEKTEDKEALPDWVQEREGRVEPLQVGGAEQWDAHTQDRDWSLPKWAGRSQPRLTAVDSETGTGSEEQRDAEENSREDLSAVSLPSPVRQAGGEEGVSSGVKQVNSGEVTASPHVKQGGGEESGEVKASLGVKQEDSGEARKSSGVNQVDSGMVGAPSAFKQDGGEDSAVVPTSSGEKRGGEEDSGVLPVRTGESESPAARHPSQVAGGKLDPSSENRMPTWARKVLDRGGESNAATLVVADDGDGEEEETVNDEQVSDGGGVPRLTGLAVEDAGCEAAVGRGWGATLGTVPSTPRTARGKSSVRMVDGMSSFRESDEQQQRPQIQVSDNIHATTESLEAPDQRPQVKSVPGMSATMETEPDLSQKPHIMMSGAMHATKQTEEATAKPHLKIVADRNANLESHEEIKSIPKLASSSHFNVSTETTSVEWAIKKPSLFGHVSQLSKQDYTFQAPKLKRQRDLHANLQSDFREFTVKPGIRMLKNRGANIESEEQVDRPLIRSVTGRHANLESEYVDVEGIRRKRFLQQNVFGHSSDSTVQRLLYGDAFGVRQSQQMEELPELREVVPRFELSALDLMAEDVDKFQDNFDHLNGQPMVDLVGAIPGVVQGGLGVVLSEGEISEEDAHTISFTPLSVLLQQALTAPLSAQISLVDEMVVNYFLVQLKIDSHFEALHRYLFMADGDFAQNLTDILLDKLSSCHLPQEMLTPVFLNSALTRALQLSSSGSQEHADSLSFALRYMPDFFKHKAHDTLDCLELRYKVKWPLNVVLTESSQACYGKVFSFMLQLKRVAWTLTDFWYRLKRDAIVKNAKDSRHFRQLQLHRQEMQHFVKVMQGYMANQIIQVTWKELQESLDHDVHSLDDLRRVHGDYLHKALFRCLLNKKAAPILKIIQDIFCLILKFCAQLSTDTWGQDSTGEAVHPNFSAMVTSYKAFKQYFVFLYKVVHKLAVMGYQPHLHELLLRLNFNDYYSTK